MPRWPKQEEPRTEGRGRQICRAMYPEIGLCELCGIKATERHHKDANTFNNVRENIMFLCHRCHTLEDGRAMRLAVCQGTRGADHRHWKGDAVKIEARMDRAQKDFPVLGKCESCPDAATDRRHIDGNIKHSSRDNLRFLCRRCCMVEDGRLEELKRVAAENSQRQLAKPNVPCVNCGSSATRARWFGRCRACSEYTRRNGVERPTKPPTHCPSGHPVIILKWKANVTGKWDCDICRKAYFAIKQRQYNERVKARKASQP